MHIRDIGHLAVLVAMQFSFTLGFLVNESVDEIASSNDRAAGITPVQVHIPPLMLPQDQVSPAILYSPAAQTSAPMQQANLIQPLLEAPEKENSGKDNGQTSTVTQWLSNTDTSSEGRRIAYDSNIDGIIMGPGASIAVVGSSLQINALLGQLAVPPSGSDLDSSLPLGWLFDGYSGAPSIGDQRVIKEKASSDPTFPAYQKPKSNSSNVVGLLETAVRNASPAPAAHNNAYDTQKVLAVKPVDIAPVAAVVSPVHPNIALPPAVHINSPAVAGGVSSCTVRNSTISNISCTHKAQIIGVSGVARVADRNYYTAGSETVPTQKVMGEIRQDPGSGMRYRGHKLMRGVNIGGFLVPEFWITPSLISSIPDPKPNDYLQLCNRLGPDATLRLMRKHWEAWVTEAEIKRLASSGLTHLRIPIGHWEFVDSDEGFVRGGLPYFKRLVYWANKYGMRVIPDMHTAPGSQNGFDNSGSTNGINWTSNQQNVAQSKRALQVMLRYIFSDPVILATVDAVDLLNEPFIDSLDFNQLWEYNAGGHTLITSGLQKIPPVISIVDRGFKEFSWWQTRWPRDWNAKFTDAYLDAHLYHVFDRNIDDWPLENHLRLVAQNGRDIKSNSTYFPIIVGEWSLALPQPALRGRENEARRRFAEAQLDAYEQGGAGWVFWCFKTESSPEWSFLDSLDRLWIPQPLTSREFQPISR
ncbi:hypothetical protein LPJ66_008455 [Kickxella alabastrina]|uniref:Uncharacterized protein n=1 Tax=Kickxella alabastrina TaxID=61397 RepID=A0ACC1I698_9FUNG|nr:hypothetical protein LPJ66_008455 [Kickxella alabastrina]